MASSALSKVVSIRWEWSVWFCFLNSVRTELQPWPEHERAEIWHRAPSLLAGLSLMWSNSWMIYDTQWRLTPFLTIFWLWHQVLLAHACRAHTARFPTAYKSSQAASLPVALLFSSGPSYQGLGPASHGSLPIAPRQKRANPLPYRVNLVDQLWKKWQRLCTELSALRTFPHVTLLLLHTILKLTCTDSIHSRLKLPLFLLPWL